MIYLDVVEMLYPFSDSKKENVDVTKLNEKKKNSVGHTKQRGPLIFFAYPN